MNRGGFMKNLGLGLFGATIATQSTANVPNTKIIDIEILVNGKKLDELDEKESYQNWVYTDFYKFDRYLENSNYKKLEEEYEKLYNSLRWYLNRLKYEDIKIWEEKLNNTDKLYRIESIKYINLISNKIIKLFPLINCKDNYFKDWSKQAYYNTVISLGEFHLIMNNNEQTFQAYSLIEKNHSLYKHKDFKYTNNPFQWMSSILNEYECYEEAYKYALLDQINRTDGTKSRLLKQLTKQLHKNG